MSNPSLERVLRESSEMSRDELDRALHGLCSLSEEDEQLRRRGLRERATELLENLAGGEALLAPDAPAWLERIERSFAEVWEEAEAGALNAARIEGEDKECPVCGRVEPVAE